jgi:hypothetical protein
MYVPSGWWHTAWNTTDTVAFTQNFLSWRRLCRDAAAYMRIVENSEGSGGDDDNNERCAARSSGGLGVQGDSCGGGAGGVGGTLRKALPAGAASDAAAEAAAAYDAISHAAATQPQQDGSHNISFVSFLEHLYGLADAASAREWVRRLVEYATEHDLFAAQPAADDDDDDDDDLHGCDGAAMRLLLSPCCT